MTFFPPPSACLPGCALLACLICIQISFVINLTSYSSFYTALSCLLRLLFRLYHFILDSFVIWVRTGMRWALCSLTYTYIIYMYICRYLFVLRMPPIYVYKYEQETLSPFRCLFSFAHSLTHSRITLPLCVSLVYFVVACLTQILVVANYLGCLLACQAQHHLSLLNRLLRVLN